MRNYVLLDFGDSSSSAEIADGYRHFATICTAKSVKRAVVAAGDDEPNAHYALRDAFTTIILADGIPRGFKLALLPRTERVQQVYRTIVRDFNVLGIEARILTDRDEAIRWIEHP